MLPEVIFFGLLLLLVVDPCQVDKVGGWKNVNDLSSPEIRSAADKAVALRVEGDPGEYAMSVSSVLRASTQVVSGMNYRLAVLVNLHDCAERDSQYVSSNKCPVKKMELCFFQLYTQPWTSTEKLTYSLCLPFVPIHPVSPLESLKTWVPVDSNDELVQKLAGKAVSLYGNLFRLESIAKTYFKFSLDECFELKFELVVKSFPCFDGILVRGAPRFCKRFSCSFELSFEVWTELQTLVSQKCSVHEPTLPPKELPDPVGGWFPLDPTTPAAKDIVSESLKLYEVQCNVRVVVHFVIEILAQVVGGMNHKIRLMLVQCSNEGEPMNCNPLKFQMSTFEVYSRPWTSTFNLVAKCQGDLLP